MFHLLTWPWGGSRRRCQKGRHHGHKRAGLTGHVSRPDASAAARSKAGWQTRLAQSWSANSTVGVKAAPPQALRLLKQGSQTERQTQCLSGFCSGYTQWHALYILSLLQHSPSWGFVNAGKILSFIRACVLIHGRHFKPHGQMSIPARYFWISSYSQCMLSHSLLSSLSFNLKRSSGNNTPPKFLSNLSMFILESCNTWFLKRLDDLMTPSFSKFSFLALSAFHLLILAFSSQSPFLSVLFPQVLISGLF